MCLLPHTVPLAQMPHAGASLATACPPPPASPPPPPSLSHLQRGSPNWGQWVSYQTTPPPKKPAAPGSPPLPPSCWYIKIRGDSPPPQNAGTPRGFAGEGGNPPQRVTPGRGGSPRPRSPGTPWGHPCPQPPLPASLAPPAPPAPSPLQLRRPHAAAPRAPAARGLPQPRPFTLCPAPLPPIGFRRRAPPPLSRCHGDSARPPPPPPRPPSLLEKGE